MTTATLPAVPVDLAFFAPDANSNKPAAWKVLHTDGTLLFESADEQVARLRLRALVDMAKIRLSAGRPVKGTDLLTLFPPTAPAPLILGALSADELTREDVFDSESQTWAMRNVEVFRSGRALKRVNGEWMVLEFTTDDVKDLVEAFAVLGWQPPLKAGHGDDQTVVLELPSLARVAGVRAAEVKDPQGLRQLGAFADLEKVPTELREAIRAGKFPQRSIEFWRGRVPRPGGKDGEKFPFVLKAVALLTPDEFPAVRGMKPLDVAPLALAAESPSDSATIDMETHPVDPATKPAAVTLSVEEYEKLKQGQESAKAALERLSADNKALQTQISRLEVDRRTETATSAAARLRDAGKITPAQEPVVLALLKTLDGDDSDRVVVETLSSDGKPSTTKQTQRAALLSLLDSFPKHPNAPGSGASRGDQKKAPSGSAEDFASLSMEDRSKAEDAVHVKLCADAKVDRWSKAGLALGDKARKGLRSGEIPVPEGI